MRILGIGILALYFATASLSSAAQSAPISSTPASEPLIELADLGTCVLAQGGVIEDCRIGYVTRGTLNADKSNAILIPTWLGGRSADLLRYVGSDKLFDPDR